MSTTFPGLSTATDSTSDDDDHDMFNQCLKDPDFQSLAIEYIQDRDISQVHNFIIYWSFTELTKYPEFLPLAIENSSLIKVTPSKSKLYDR